MVPGGGLKHAWTGEGCLTGGLKCPHFRPSTLQTHPLKKPIIERPFVHRCNYRGAVKWIRGTSNVSDSTCWRSGNARRSRRLSSGKTRLPHGRIRGTRTRHALPRQRKVE